MGTPAQHESFPRHSIQGSIQSMENMKARVWQPVAACLVDVSLPLAPLFGQNAGLLPVNAFKCLVTLREGSGRGEGELYCVVRRS